MLFKNNSKNVFSKNIKEAETILGNQEGIQKLIANTIKVSDKWSKVLGKVSNIEQKRSGLISNLSILEYIPKACRMVEDYVNGNYREVPLSSVVASTAMFLYIISPLNVVLNTIPGLGWLDEIMGIPLVIYSIQKDIDKYWIWKCSAENEEYEDSVEV